MSRECYRHLKGGGRGAANHLIMHKDSALPAANNSLAQNIKTALATCGYWKCGYCDWGTEFWIWILDFSAALHDCSLKVFDKERMCLGPCHPHSPTTISLLRNTLGLSSIISQVSSRRGTQQIDHPRHKHWLGQEALLNNKIEQTPRNRLQLTAPDCTFTSQNKTQKVYWRTCRTHDSYVHYPNATLWVLPFKSFPHLNWPN